MRALAEEIAHRGFLSRVGRTPGVHMGLDFFNASINRIAAWTTGARATIKALLIALLEPTALLRQFEEQADNTARLAMLEEIKTLPLGPVWDYYCLKQAVPVGSGWLNVVKQYENDVLSRRH